MAYTSFQIRINERVGLEEIGARVGKALDLHFTPSHAKNFEGDEALETTVLGLWITLNYIVPAPNSEVRNYRLTGTPRTELIGVWDDKFTDFDISLYILEVLVKLDDSRWYIPDLKEMYLESGLPWPNLFGISDGESQWQSQLNIESTIRKKPWPKW